MFHEGKQVISEQTRRAPVHNLPPREEQYPIGIDGIHRSPIDPALRNHPKASRYQVMDVPVLSGF